MFKKMRINNYRRRVTKVVEEYGGSILLPLMLNNIKSEMGKDLFAQKISFNDFNELVDIIENIKTKQTELLKKYC